DLIFRATGHACEINRRWKHDRDAFEPLPGDALAELRTLAASCRIDVPAALPPALACLVGYFGYETIGLVETLPRAPQSALALPAMLFARPTLILVFAGLIDELFCTAPLWADGTDPDHAVGRAAERIDEVLRRLELAPPQPHRDTELPEMALTPVMDAADYEAMVHRAKDYITAGDIFQVVLAQRFTCPFPLPPIALYRALRRVNPSPFLYFLDLPGFPVVGASPAILVRLRDGEVTTPPAAIRLLPRAAGLRRRRRDPGDPRARARRRGDDPAHRRNAAARPDERGGPRSRSQPPGRPEGTRRAPDAPRPRPQRRRPRRRGRQRRGHSQLHDRALQPRDAHRQQRRRPVGSFERRARRALCRFSRRHRIRRAEGPR